MKIKIKIQFNSFFWACYVCMMRIHLIKTNWNCCQWYLLFLNHPNWIEYFFVFVPKISVERMLLLWNVKLSLRLKIFEWFLGVPKRMFRIVLESWTTHSWNCIPMPKRNKLPFQTENSCNECAMTITTMLLQLKHI